MACWRSVTRLEELAPALAAGVDTRNPRRVVRALEIAELRGDGPPPPPRGYPGPIAWLGLAVHPHAHAARIATRARAQFDAGLIEEARALRERFDPALPAFSAIGYREAWAVLDGELTRDAAIELDAQRNLAFSKRQRTWFRSEPDITWLDATADTPDRGRARARPLPVLTLVRAPETIVSSRTSSMPGTRSTTATMDVRVVGVVDDRRG